VVPGGYETALRECASGGVGEGLGETELALLRVFRDSEDDKAGIKAEAATPETEDKRTRSEEKFKSTKRVKIERPDEE
jgi:hypothetical protein